MADASLNADRFLSRLKRLHAQWTKGELIHAKRGREALGGGGRVPCLFSLLRRAATWLGRRRCSERDPQWSRCSRKYQIWLDLFFYLNCLGANATCHMPQQQ